MLAFIQVLFATDLVPTSNHSACMNSAPLSMSQNALLRKDISQSLGAGRNPRRRSQSTIYRPVVSSFLDRPQSTV